MPIGVLIVDDDQDVCVHMQRLLLENNGINAATLNDPTKTLDKLREGTYHIIILDLVMPGMHGIDLLNQVRRYDDDIAIVVVTGYPTVETAVQSLKHSVSDYIRKPFDAEEFHTTIEAILRKKGLLSNPEEELHATIGKSIRQLRKEHGLTLKQMSRRTGLSVSLLSQIERAESSASVSSLFKIATALDSKLTSLFGSF
ncbi:MAG: two-component system response regulator [Deltaproteobacteria bacterium CG2_30_63_29]|nr:MAG: two-component system response regulator [Deltaproteobacteria bacterium CG2_30_63_29]